MYSYRFELGQSNEGSGIGICFSIEAEDAASAIEKANIDLEALASELNISGGDFSNLKDIRFYFGPDTRVTGSNIVDRTDCDYR